ncbi:MAG: 4-hydroxy-3-methylbut-2-enyl diphosphate reductase [Candidatus Omnitrophica bacterium]|nr:4-hydroxy-3-methylbut-2-enyl diphosphate reductase [Candidatus Omnitrophota bacterium]MCF7894286.1 4-hydroxy-3-methylbut-2-enyl diphosphate reductase [Candidatus Omnitrophota bacterium]
MKINIAKSAGFCLGVKQALIIADEAVKNCAKIDMLGDIVHNEEVVKQIKKMGIKKINKLTNGKDKTLLIRAHGAPKSTYRKAKKLGYKIIDATCPMVKEIHQIAKQYQNKGYKIIIIGDKKHDEVQGIVGQLDKEPLVFNPKVKIEKKMLKGLKKAVVISQSTQNIDEVKNIVYKIKKYIPHLKFIDTICKPTRQKQNEIKTMSYQNELVLIIGSKASANTKRLYQISRKINPKTYWIENEKKISPHWFKNIKSVGITAGASTPENIIKSVVKKIKNIG